MSTMESLPKVSSRSTLPVLTAPKPWNYHLTLDTLLKVCGKTIFSPFIGWVIVLCLRAQVTPVTDTAFILSVIYATTLTILLVARVINQRIAYGVPRQVDPANEVVLVTGGASGLGLLIAQIYAMKGTSVAVMDIRKMSDKEQDEVFGENVHYITCDVGDRRALESAKEEVEQQLGPPSIIINCAAAGIHGRPLLHLPAQDFEKTVRTNLMAAFSLYQTFVPNMMTETENGGTIVTVSSVLGQLSPAGLSDYSASKAGLSALHRTMEAELRGEEHIKFLLVETGQMATPLFGWIRTPSHFFAPVLDPLEVAREIVDAVDSGRGGVVRLPTFATLVSWYAVLPGAIQLIARYLSRIDNAVASATPQTERRETRISQQTEKKVD